MRIRGTADVRGELVRQYARPPQKVSLRALAMSMRASAEADPEEEGTQKLIYDTLRVGIKVAMGNHRETKKEDDERRKGEKAPEESLLDLKEISSKTILEDRSR